MKLKKKKTIWIIAFFIVIGVIASFSSIMIKDFSHFESEEYVRNKSKTTKVLVLCYSRSGNTESMAKEIAKYYNAELKFIETEVYTLNFKGWRRAAVDANAHTESPIKPEIIDMENYDLIFLGSPIWLFRPAPPLWTFVRNNDFTEKKVVLFNTFNSRFKQKNIDEFNTLISSKGGTPVGHIYVKRGRAIPLLQEDGNYVAKETRKLLDKNEKNWRN